MRRLVIASAVVLATVTACNSVAMAQSSVTGSGTEGNLEWAINITGGEGSVTFAPSLTPETHPAACAHVAGNTAFVGVTPSLESPNFGGEDFWLFVEDNGTTGDRLAYLGIEPIDCASLPDMSALIQPVDSGDFTVIATSGDADGGDDEEDAND